MIKTLFLFYLILRVFLEDCTNFNSEYFCIDDQTEYPESWDERSFQTPPRDDPNWRKNYQDMSYLVDYAQLKYSSDRKICTINFIIKVNPNINNYKIIYQFGEREQESNSLTITSSKSYLNGFPISARLQINGQDVAKLELEDQYFLWDNPTVNQGSQYENGQKGSIVEMFGWPYNDITEECDFLAKAGYMGVNVFSVNEHILIYDTVEDGELNPWWFIYQPVSYRLTSRGGTKKELKNMINTCRQKGVRVYADVVMNHMTKDGNDMYLDHRNNADFCFHWGPKQGSDDSPWWTTGWQYQNNPYTGKKPSLEFPAVPYTASDFHCKKNLDFLSDPFILSHGWLDGLTDLNTEKEYVRQRIADFIVTLLSIGISGIRIDFAKYIHPTDLVAIFKKIKDNLGGGELPEDFIAYLEILYEKEKNLLMCGGGDYSFGKPFVKKMKAVGLSDTDILKIKILGSDYPKNFPICGWWEIDPSRHVIGLDYHNDQFPGSSSRDMQEKGSVYIKERNKEKHKYFLVQMFRRTDFNWKIKLVLSSYSFINDAYGYPDGKSDCTRCTGEQCKNNCRKSVPYQKAYNPASIGYDTESFENWKENEYTRTHRDIEVINSMRIWMELPALTYNQLYTKEKLKLINLKNK